jgi:hypothetical protein
MVMTDDTAEFGQADEEILTYTVSDDALEAAAGTGMGDWTGTFFSRAGPGCCLN